MVFCEEVSQRRLKTIYVKVDINENNFILEFFGKPHKRKEFTNFGINGRTSSKTKRVELFYYN